MTTRKALLLPDPISPELAGVLADKAAEGYQVDVITLYEKGCRAHGTIWWSSKPKHVVPSGNGASSE